MKKISCIAIDDEPLALLILEKFCERKGNIHLTTFSEPSLGLESINIQCPDVVFLDIEMNGMNGLQIANSLNPACCLIFTTAHAQYALEGFNLNAIDYLHKPFSYERFERALDKAMRMLNKCTIEAESIVVKQEYNNISITLNDIIYIEAVGNYSKIIRIGAGNILSRTNMKAMLTLLPAEHFVRIHRSYIVSIAQIETFNKRQITMRGNGKSLPIGQQYANELFRRIGIQQSQLCPTTK